MKRLLRIFDLTKHEQRVVLIVVVILITIAFVGYERRFHPIHVQAKPATVLMASPSPLETDEEQ